MHSSFWNVHCPRAYCSLSARLVRQLGLACMLFAGLAANNASAAADERAAPVLRVLKLRYQEINHPHRDAAGESRLLSDFARRNGMTVQWIDAVQPADLRQQLESGDGDIVIADLPPTAPAEAALLPSVSMGAFHYVLIGRDELQVENPSQLTNLKVAISLASPLWQYFNDLAVQVSGLTMVVLPDNTSRAAILDGITRGDYDAGVVSARPSEDLAAANPRLKRLFPLSDLNLAVWRFAPENTALRDRLDSYLKRYHGTLAEPYKAFGDLDQIRRRHVLRVITRVDPQNYFLKRGRRAGFEYELVREFARDQGLAVEFLVADDDEQVLEWLRSGAGDLVATRADAASVRADPALTLSRHYFHSAAVVINRNIGPPLGIGDLGGKRIAVLRNSVPHRSLTHDQGDADAPTIVIFNPDTPFADLAARIKRGELDAAVVDAHAVDSLLSQYPDIQAGPSLPTEFNYAWTLRTTDRALGSAVDDFLRSRFRRETYNILARRYFEHPGSARFTSFEKISPYDDLVQRHAASFDFDWRLIVALMYQESKFNPSAQSSAGALGLMQLLPATARAVGVRNPLDPEAGIRGGVAYLDRLRRRFDSDISPRERTWFALAAYNIGFHRVDLARRQAAEAGLDPNRWFGNVERSMRSMAGQTVMYVRAVRSLYNTYSRVHDTLTAGTEAGATAPPI